MIQPSRGDDDATAVLLITVEEYFQARAFRDLVSPGEWEALPSRVELGVDRLLELLERHGSRATFFFHPWPAERRPDVVGRVAEAGHEVAALGACGARSEPLTREEVLAGVGRARGLLEELCDRSVRGHRSRSSSLSLVGDELYDMLVAQGYTYFASGVGSWPWDGLRPRIEAIPRPANETEGALLELTTTKLKVLGRPLLPACGTVLRNVPPRKVASGLQGRADEGHLPVFHMNAWEVDPDQPDLPVAPIDRIRHYRGLEGAAERLEQLLSEVSFDSVEGRFGLDRPESENGYRTLKTENSLRTPTP